MATIVLNKNPGWLMTGLGGAINGKTSKIGQNAGFHRRIKKCLLVFIVEILNLVYTTRTGV